MLGVLCLAGLAVFLYLNAMKNAFDAINLRLGTLSYSGLRVCAFAPCRTHRPVVYMLFIPISHRLSNPIAIT